MKEKAETRDYGRMRGQSTRTTGRSTVGRQETLLLNTGKSGLGRGRVVWLKEEVPTRRYSFGASVG